MGHILGTTVADLRAAGPLTSGIAIALAVAILDALAPIHAAQLIHRDLNPQHIVRRADTVAIDLGRAVAFRSGRERTASTSSTPPRSMHCYRLANDPMVTRSSSMECNLPYRRDCEPP